MIPLTAEAKVRASDCAVRGGRSTLLSVGRTGQTEAEGSFIHNGLGVSVTVTNRGRGWSWSYCIEESAPVCGPREGVSSAQMAFRLADSHARSVINRAAQA